MAAVYLIVSRSSGKALTCPNLNANSPTPHLPVQQYEQGDRFAQQYWTLEPTRPGGKHDFLIHPFLVPGFAIAVNRTDLSDPTKPAWLWLDESAAGQVWRVNRIANPPYYYILEGDNDLLMDVPDGSGDDGVTIRVNYRTENDNQQWTFLPAFDQISS
jgi:hypothetical protein